MLQGPHAWGYDWTPNGYCDAYNIGTEVTTVMYPHVHLIPRRKGDMKIKGGVIVKTKIQSSKKIQDNRFVYGGDCV